MVPEEHNKGEFTVEEIQEETIRPGSHAMTKELEIVKDFEDWNRTKLLVFTVTMVKFQLGKEK